MVELRCWLIQDGRPGTSSVEGNAGSPVVSFNHAVRVAWVDPEIVVVAVRGWDGFERFPAVDRFPALKVQHPDSVGIARIGKHMMVVPGPASKLGVVAKALPGFAVVIRSKQSPFGSFDDRPHPSRLGRRCGDADSAENARWQSLRSGQVSPAVAAVERPPEAGVFATAVHRVRIPLRLPERGVQHSGITRIQAKIDRAGAIALVENLLPGSTAVGGSKDTALLVRPPGVAQRGDVGNVGVAGVDPNPADMAGIG